MYEIRPPGTVRSGMDWDTEGLLEGLEDDAARDARRRLLDELHAGGMGVEPMAVEQMVRYSSGNNATTIDDGRWADGSAWSRPGRAAPVAVLEAMPSAAVLHALSAAACRLC